MSSSVLTVLLKKRIMGTNYYLHQKPACSHCGHQAKPLHIGKSSFGWHFSLHVIPEDDINDLDDWKRLWDDPESSITNEYAEVISKDEMFETITNRRGSKSWDEHEWSNGWYKTEAQFHRQNRSERGLNNLLRHRVDGDHCIKNGEGTWDCIVGEFS